MLKIVGDINFSDGYFDLGFGIGSKIANGIDLFCHLERKVEDFWIGNFECVCTTLDVEKPFIITPQNLDNIRLFDLFGVANNHVMQYGNEAYREMLHYLDRNNILYVGCNKRRSVRFEHQGKKIGILAFSQRPDNFTHFPLYWSLPEYKEIEMEIESLSDCDFNIAYIHWGNEFINYPYNDQKQFAHFLIDSGIDLIIGMHPHVMQGFEIYNGKHIFYSLGNFVFYMPWEPTKYSLIINVDFEADKIVTTEYVKIGTDSLPRVVSSVPKEYSVEYLNRLIEINEENEKYYAKVTQYYKKYRTVNRRTIIRDFIHMKNRYRIDIIKDFINRKIK